MLEYGDERVGLRRPDAILEEPGDVKEWARSKTISGGNAISTKGVPPLARSIKQ